MPGEESNINLPRTVPGDFKGGWDFFFFFNLPGKSCKINTDVLVLKIRRLRLKEKSYVA